MAEKILIVDDDIDSLKLIGLMLQRHGYEVVAANAGSQAISKAVNERPDLIILDVMMPDMDGYEVCRRLRAEQVTVNIPIIMFTAKTLIDDKIIGFEAGADDYLTKPTHPAELASRVKAMLARYREKNANNPSAQPEVPQQSSGNTGRISNTPPPMPENRTSSPRASVIQPVSQPPQRPNFDFPEPPVAPPPPPPPSFGLGVMGVKGGVGTTTIATNIAAAMLTAGDKPLLADWCLGYGNLGLYLGHSPVPSIANMISRPVSDINDRNVNGQIITHQSGLRLLLSSSRPQEAQINFSTDSVRALLGTLKKISNPVVCDLGSRYNLLVSQVARELDQLVVVLEPNKVSLAMARELFQSLEADGIGRGRLNIVVINRAQSSLQTPWQEIEQHLGQDIKAIISAAPELAFQTIEANMPMVLFRPNSITSNQLAKLAEDFRNRSVSYR